MEIPLGIVEPLRQGIFREGKGWDAILTRNIPLGSTTPISLLFHNKSIISSLFKTITQK
jgi:hypothetical protein